MKAIYKQLSNINLFIWAMIITSVSMFTACQSDDDPSGPMPTITGFSPTSGAEGSTVVIAGTNFSTQISNNVVKFNGKTAVVTGSTPTSLSVIVPMNATSGKISVSVQNATATSDADFTVTLVPTISAITPSGGLVGTDVTITGTKFSTIADENIVEINGVAIDVNEATATTLKITIPEGVTTGKITVTANDQTVTSAEDFTVMSLYLAGYDGSVAKFWKDGVVTELSDNASPGSHASSIAISGEDVYVGGGLHGVGTYWKNGEPVPVGNTRLYSIQVLNDDVYSSGLDAYYKNDEEFLMPTLNSSLARSIFVSGDDIHIAGSEYNGSKNVARYWKNDAVTELSDGSAHGAAISMVVSGTDIHVVGYDAKKARYWKNGVGTDLTDGVETAIANTIFLDGDDVYIGGNDGNVAKYWKNGEEVSLTTGAGRSSVNSIFVLNGVVYAAGYVYGMGADVATLWINGEPTSFSDATTEGRLNAIVIK